MRDVGCREPIRHLLISEVSGVDELVAGDENVPVRREGSTQKQWVGDEKEKKRTRGGGSTPTLVGGDSDDSEEEEEGGRARR